MSVEWGWVGVYLRSDGLLGFCLLSDRLDSRASRMGFLVREQVLPGRYLEGSGGTEGRLVEIIFFSSPRLSFCPSLLSNKCSYVGGKKERKDNSWKNQGQKGLSGDTASYDTKAPSYVPRAVLVLVLVLDRECLLSLQTPHRVISPVQVSLYTSILLLIYLDVCSTCMQLHPS